MTTDREKEKLGALGYRPTDDAVDSLAYAFGKENPFWAKALADVKDPKNFKKHMADKVRWLGDYDDVDPQARIMRQLAG